MLPPEAEPGSTFERARRETIRYHEELYATTALGEPETWLAKPQRMILEAIASLPTERPLVAYDLGAGIGRHTLPMLERLPPQSSIVAVDLLPSALQKLEASATTIRSTKLHTFSADLNTFEFPWPADLVVVFSAIEHLPTLDCIRALLDRIAGAMNTRGVVAIGIIADRYEVWDGHRRPALLESAITSQQAQDLLTASFESFKIIRNESRHVKAAEERDGQRYVLASTLVTLVAQRPDLHSS